MGLTVRDFEEYISNLIDNMEQRYIELVSGDIHRALGEYPNKNHHMPSCCDAMRKLMIPGDIVMHHPPKGKGASLKIRYYKRLQ